MAAWAGSSSASSSSRARWASKMAASASPARAATASRSRPIASRAARWPRRGARARARARRARGRAAGRWARRGGARAPSRRRPRPPRRRARRPTRGQRTSAAARRRGLPRRRRRRSAGRRRDAVAEALVGQRAQRRQRLGRLRARRAHHQRVAEARAERDDVGEARRAHRRAAAGLGHAHLGVVVARDADEQRRRPGVQPDRVADLQALLRVGGRRGLLLARRARRLLDAELRGLHGQRAARLGRHLLQGGAPARGHRRGHGALHQRGVAHQHAADGAVEHLDGELGAHERAAEVHEHEHAVVGHGALDRRAHPLGVGAQRPGLVHPARGLQLELLAAHLARQRHDALRERLAVGDDDEADH